MTLEMILKTSCHKYVSFCLERVCIELLACAKYQPNMAGIEETVLCKFSF